MRQDNVTFRSLMDRVSEGSQDAAWELISEYGSYIERVVRHNLNRQLRSKYDSIDFVQAVWASFFRDRERFDDFAEANQLIGFLMVVARNKVLQESRRRFNTQRYNVRREEALSSGDALRDEKLRDREPTPSQWVMARERWDTLIRAQSPKHQRLIEMRVGGATFEEIAAELGINERTARRVIERLLGELSE